MINFEAEPSVSSSNLWIDGGLPNDDRLKLTKFPLRHEFPLTGRGWRPFVQGTLAKFSLEQTIPISGGEKIEPKWSSYSGSLGGGVRIPVGERWSILPAFEVGYAGLSNDVTYNGPIGNGIYRPIFDEILFDWTADAWIASGHLSARYRGRMDKLDVDGSLSATLSHIESFRTTDGAVDFQEDIGTLSAKLDGTYPLGVSVAGYPLSLIGHLGCSTFVGPQRDALGFSYVGEAGLSLEVDISRHDLPVSKLSLGAMGLYGDKVKGWSILFDYGF